MGISFISHQKNTKEGLKREGLGRRSVWDLGSGLVVAATRMTSNTCLTTRLSQACSQQLAPFSLSTALGRLWVGKAQNPTVLTSNTTSVFPSTDGTLEFSEEFVSSLQEILSALPKISVCKPPPVFLMCVRCHVIVLSKIRGVGSTGRQSSCKFYGWWFGLWISGEGRKQKTWVLIPALPWTSDLTSLRLFFKFLVY